MPELTVGASYAYYEDAGDTGLSGKDEITVYSIGLAYTLAPGLSIRPEYHYFDFANEGGQRDEDGNIFMVRTQVSF
jgi:predicted porin